MLKELNIEWAKIYIHSASMVKRHWRELDIPLGLSLEIQVSSLGD